MRHPGAQILPDPGAPAPAPVIHGQQAAPLSSLCSEKLCSWGSRGWVRKSDPASPLPLHHFQTMADWGRQGVEGRSLGEGGEGLGHQAERGASWVGVGAQPGRRSWWDSGLSLSRSSKPRTRAPLTYQTSSTNTNSKVSLLSISR